MIFFKMLAFSLLVFAPVVGVVILIVHAVTKDEPRSGGGGFVE